MDITEQPWENESAVQEFIEVFGAREHNLKNIDISIPKNKLVVFESYIDDKKIIFISSVVGTKEDFVAVEKAAVLFEQALDKRGVQYKAVMRKDFLGP